MMTRFRTAALLIILIAVAGCFQYQEQLVIQSNGSGTISMHYALDKTIVDQMASLGAMMSFDSAAAPRSEFKFFDRRKIDSTLAARNVGIKLLSFDEKKTDSTYLWDMKFSFTDISNLGFLENSLKQGTQEYTEPTEDSLPKIVFAKQADGTWLFERKSEFDDMAAPPEGGVSESVPEESVSYNEPPSTMSDSGGVWVDSSGAAFEGMGEELAKMMAPLAGVSMELSVTFPGKIISTNATSQEGNTAVWKFGLGEKQQTEGMMRAVIKME